MNEIQKRKRAESVEPQQQSKRPRLITEKNFSIQELPRELLLVIFDFLDLAAWKESRSVCHLWNETLCLFTFTSKFPLKIKYCEVVGRIGVMSTFRHTFSSFPVIEIKCIYEFGKVFFKLFEVIGKETIKLSLKWKKNSFGTQPPAKLLVLFPKLQSIECSIEYLVSCKIPSNVKNFHLTGVKNIMDPVSVGIIENIIKDESKKITIDALNIKDFYCEDIIEDDIEFIKICKTLKEFNAVYDIEFPTIDLRHVRQVNVSDVTTVSYIFPHERQDKWEEVLVDSSKFPNVNHVVVKVVSNNEMDIDNTDCIHALHAVEHLSVQKLSINSNFFCPTCFRSVIKSFPNLKEFKSFAPIDFNWLVESCPTLEKVKIKFDDLEPLIQMPNASLENFVKIKKLTFYQAENLNSHWNEFVKKLPEMPNLQKLIFTHPFGDISNYFNFFSLCPNLESIIFEDLTDFDLLYLIEILIFFPKLKIIHFILILEQNKKYISKAFIDAIAPHAKCLQILCLNFVFKNDKGSCMTSTYSLDDFNRYALQKIPTLRELTF